METVVAILLWGAALSVAIGAAKAVVGLVRAPEGYQNHDGFHYTGEGRRVALDESPALDREVRIAR